MIDGNHRTLADRGCQVPTMFEHFQGYNKPELRKKRKIDHTNLNGSEIQAHSVSLFTLAGNSYMKPFSVFVAATEEEIQSLWDVRQIDSSLERKDTTKVLTKEKELQEFMQSHCKVRHYMFSVKKCTDTNCSVCNPPRLPTDVFSTIHHLPDPIPNGDKYKDFEEVYGTQTSENHRPSLSSPGAKTHGMPFSPSAQYAKNVKVVLQCGECFKWRVLYSKYSLKKDQREELEQLIEDLDYTCGSIFADIEAEEDSVLNSVYVKANLTCNSTIEIPYYTAGNAPMCYHCGSEDKLQEKEKVFPICLSCLNVGKKTRSKEVQVTTLSILSCFYIFDIKLFTFVYIHIHQHVQFLNIKILVHSLHCRKEVNNG